MEKVSIGSEKQIKWAQSIKDDVAEILKNRKAEDVKLAKENLERAKAENGIYSDLIKGLADRDYDGDIESAKLKVIQTLEDVLDHVEEAPKHQALMSVIDAKFWIDTREMKVARMLSGMWDDDPNRIGQIRVLIDGSKVTLVTLKYGKVISGYGGKMMQVSPDRTYEREYAVA